MLTVQACQQHRLAVMPPNKAKSFPAATTVPAVAKLGHRRRGKRGTRSEERGNARRAHASKQKKCRRWRSRGVVGVPYPTRRKNEGKNLGRKHPELSEKRRVFARKKRRGKRASPPARNTRRPPGRGLGWRSSRSVRWRCRFFRVFFVPFPPSICMESTPYVLSFRVVFFLPCDHGLDF